MGSDQVVGGRYRLTGILGEGGMGAVYRGVDLRGGDPVAVKLLKSDILKTDVQLIERFTREGEALRQLNHPNIVKMLDAIEEDGRHYLVMQYVGGGSLRDLLDRTPQLPVERVLSIGIELADALTRAHHLKIIHRDLKPENVLLDDNGTPLLTDFGVARLGTRTRVTETGSVIGTYAYLSPEACRAEPLDTRTDIWSFGIMLYEMLAGRRPYDSDQAAAILLAIIQQPLPDLRQFRPDAPPALVDLIGRMLQKDHEHRIPSVRLVGAALEAIAQGTDAPLPTSHLQDRAADSPRFATSTPAESQPAAPEIIEEPIIITMPTPAPAAPAESALPRAARSKRWIGAVVGLAVILIAAALLIVVLGGGDGDKKPAGVSKVAPVQPGEYMVLVAQVEPLQNVQEREVSRFIVESLKETLEEDVPFSMVRVRSYPQVITSDEQAQAAAAANGATVVVWGNYTPSLVQLEVQIGVTTAFKYIQFDRETLERTANVRVQLADERRESIAPQVLGVVNLLFAADGNPYGSTNILAILDEIQVTSATVVSGGVSGYLQRGAADYFENTEQAISAYDAAIALQPGNPLPYTYRNAAFFRLGLFDQALRDLETARRLGPQGWSLPLFSEGMYTTSQLDYDETLRIFDQVVTLRPDDGFVINYRGAMYYLKAEYDRAQADFDRAMALSPELSYPYVLSIMNALHRGRLADLQSYIRSMTAQFPDPYISNRLIQAIFGDKVPSIFGPVFAAAGNLILGQYNQVILDTQTALALDPHLADMELVQGLAYCNLKDYAAAEAAYTRGIESQPDFIALYALRAEVRLKQQKLAESLEDGRVVQESDLADVFNPLLEAGLAGDWNCEQFFSFDYSQLGTEHAQ